MTLEGPDGRRYLVRKDGSLVMKGDGHGRPVTMDELDPACTANRESPARREAAHRRGQSGR